MWLEFSFNGKYKWIDMYKQLINKYNNRVHRTIKKSTSKVNSSNESPILQTSYNHLKIFVVLKFRKGDHVRIRKFKHVFEKGYTPNYTTEIFKIRKVKNTYPKTYSPIHLIYKIVIFQYVPFEIKDYLMILHRSLNYFVSSHPTKMNLILAIQHFLKNLFRLITDVLLMSYHGLHYFTLQSVFH